MAVDIDNAVALQHVGDRGDRAVRPVPVGAVLETLRFVHRDRSGSGTGGCQSLRAQPADRVPGLAQRDPAHTPFGLTPRLVVGERDGSTGCPQQYGPVPSVVLPHAYRVRRGHAANTPAQYVVGRAHGGSVAGFRQDPAPGITLVGQFRPWTDHSADLPAGVVLIACDALGCPLLRHLAEVVADIFDGLARAVGLTDEPSDGVEAVGLDPSVEIPFPDQTARLVVEVLPGEALLVGHGGDTQFAVVGEPHPRAVGVRARQEQVEAAVLETSHPTLCVDVLDEVALSVIAASFRAAVGQVEPKLAAFRAPAHPCDGPVGAHLRDHPSERITDVPRDAALGIRDRKGQARRVGLQHSGTTERVGDCGECAVGPVPIADTGSCGVRLSDQIAMLVVLQAPRVTIGLDHVDGLPPRVVLGRLLAAVGPDDGSRGSCSVVGVAGCPAACVRPCEQPVVPVPLGTGGVPQRVGHSDELVAVVPAVRRRVARRVGVAGLAAVGVIGDGAPQEAAGALTGHAAVLVVVSEAVPVAVAIGPGGNAGVIVVRELQRETA
ncbi:hypothetical protein [Streptomyces coeruleorubidus]|uniref:hypothetical protein n=1 Tax=Streptomyces coeruleorubidus TaxID=116188 RepID=UPI003F4D3E2E